MWHFTRLYMHVYDIQSILMFVSTAVGRRQASYTTEKILKLVLNQSCFTLVDVGSIMKQKMCMAVAYQR